jgi:hypothetical protein
MSGLEQVLRQAPRPAQLSLLLSFENVIFYRLKLGYQIEL